MGARADLVQLDRVRCLECSRTYVKPADGGTVHENPGCPRCGYVGWVPATLPSPDELRRSGEDPRPPRRARRR
jgi:hypothetical protein